MSKLEQIIGKHITSPGGDRFSIVSRCHVLLDSDQPSPIRGRSCHRSSLFGQLLLPQSSAMGIPGRVAHQCAHFYQELLPRGELINPALIDTHLPTNPTKFKDDRKSVVENAWMDFRQRVQNSENTGELRSGNCSEARKLYGFVGDGLSESIRGLMLPIKRSLKLKEILDPRTNNSEIHHLPFLTFCMLEDCRSCKKGRKVR
jgi:hypothetical protein